ncbi:hypothetical protein [Chitinophaga polysaccharea]|uniref:hypothetical protein n=1 Tax=Chitinophaga polysaccharea TaxID=1293035 RepID=UPI001C8E53D7
MNGALLEANLIDEMIIHVIPVALGSIIPGNMPIGSSVQYRGQMTNRPIHSPPG